MTRSRADSFMAIPRCYGPCAVFIAVRRKQRRLLNHKRIAAFIPLYVSSAGAVSALATTLTAKLAGIDLEDYCHPPTQWFYSSVSTSILQKTGILLTNGRDFWECGAPKNSTRYLRDFRYR